MTVHQFEDMTKGRAVRAVLVQGQWLQVAQGAPVSCRPAGPGARAQDQMPVLDFLTPEGRSLCVPLSQVLAVEIG